MSFLFKVKLIDFVVNIPPNVARFELATPKLLVHISLESRFTPGPCPSALPLCFHFEVWGVPIVVQIKGAE